MLMAITIVLTCFSGNGISVNAEEMGEDIDFSYLLTDETLVGYATLANRGIYLAEGNSYINKNSSTKIGAGGTTNAAVKCRVGITCVVERQTTTGWARVTSWNQENDSAFMAIISKVLTVGTGYYYRVRSTHYASSDVSSSCTNALRM